MSVSYIYMTITSIFRTVTLRFESVIVRGNHTRRHYGDSIPLLVKTLAGNIIAIFLFDSGKRRKKIQDAHR